MTTAYLDPRSGETFPLDTPRWCGTNKAPLFLTDLPGLTRAVKLQDKAAQIGFDWPSIAPVLDKIKEEIQELEAAISETESSLIEEEFGDLLFVMANLARHLKIDPETALQKANLKFIRRFRHIETRLAEQNIPLAEAGLERMDALWDEARAADKAKAALRR